MLICRQYLHWLIQILRDIQEYGSGRLCIPVTNDVWEDLSISEAKQGNVKWKLKCFKKMFIRYNSIYNYHKLKIKSKTQPAMELLGYGQINKSDSTLSKVPNNLNDQYDLSFTQCFLFYRLPSMKVSLSFPKSFPSTITEFLQPVTANFVT